MRIRSIKPDFWRSEDITSLAIEDRLLFIGLWSYVDDNGVGRDDVAIIAAELFAHDLAILPLDTLARVQRGLDALSERGLIRRYMSLKRLIYVTNWEKHQRIDRPSKTERYSRPDQGFPSDPMEAREDVASVHRGLDAGEGEKGRRGEEEQAPSSAAPKRFTVRRADFERFWEAYPRKVAKQDADRAYERHARQVSPEVIQAGVERMRDDPNLPDRAFIPYPATWLNAGGWDDEPFPSRTDGRPEPKAPPKVKPFAYREGSPR